MRRLTLYLLCVVGQAATFNLQEFYGTNHFDQVIQFATTGKIDRSTTTLLGPNGAEVAWAQKTDGKLLVENHLPSATLPLTYSITGIGTGGSNAVVIGGGATPFFPTTMTLNKLFQLNWSGTVPTGLTNHVIYSLKTYDNNTGYTTWAPAGGGSTISLSGSGSSGTMIAAGWVSSGNTITQPDHTYNNGDVLSFTETSATCPTGITYNGTTPYYVINTNQSSGTYQISTSLGGSADSLGSFTTGCVPQVVVNFTWTTTASASTNLLPTNPVTLIKNGNNWEITNGLTGIRIPTTEGNATPFDLSPIQGIQQADGSWTACGVPCGASVPNYFYAFPSGDSGNLSAAMQTRAGYLITAYKASIIENNPMMVTIEVDYTMNRPHYQYGSLVDIAAGAGHFIEKITLYANQPVAGEFERDTDMVLSWFVNFYPDLTDKPDYLRWRGGSANTSACGALPHGGAAYAGVNTVYNTPAYRDIDYSQDVPVTSAGLCDATHNKPLSPFITYAGDDGGGWYQMIYKNAGSSSSPLIGIFTGPLSKMGVQQGSGVNGSGDSCSTPYANTPGFYSSDADFITSATAGGVQFLSSVWCNMTNPVTSYAIYVSTKTNLAADGTQPFGIIQPIQITQNVISGPNLTDLASFVLNFADPAGGWKSPYISDSLLTTQRDRIRDGTSFCGSTDCYYNRLSYLANPIITMWRGQSAAAVDTALNGFLIRLNYLAHIMTQGNGAMRDSGSGLPATNSSLVWTPYTTLGAMIMIDDFATAAQKANTKAYMAFPANMYWHENFLPLSTGLGINATQNQIIQIQQLAAAFTSLLPSNPVMITKQAAARASTVAQIPNVTNVTGALVASTWYQGADMYPVVSNLQALASPQIGVYSFTGARTMAAPADLSTLTPPDPRFGNLRKAKGDGDGNEAANARLCLDATVFNPSLSSLAQNWMWGCNSTSSSTYLTADQAAVLTTIQVDDTITQTDPVLKSSTFPGSHSHHRLGWETDYETAAWVINGDYYNDHRHGGDYGQVSMFALKAPMSVDITSNLHFPSTNACYIHNVLCLDADLPQAWDTDSPSISVGDQTFNTSAQADFFAGAHSTRSVSTFTDSGSGSVWTRTVTTTAADPKYPVISIKDDITGSKAADARVISLNMISDPSHNITTPAGNQTPTFRTSGNCLEPPSALPFSGTASTLSSGLNHWLFTGMPWTAHAAGGINWDLYTNSAVGTQQFLIGDYETQCQNNRELNEFNTVNSRAYTEYLSLLRLHATGTTRIFIAPFRKTETPTRTNTGPNNNDFHTVNSTSGFTENHTDTEISASNGTIKLSVVFDTGSHTLNGITLSGGAQEVYQADSTHLTWTGCGATEQTLTFTLPAGTWYPDGPVVGTGPYTLYCPANVQPVPTTINFTTSGSPRTITKYFGSTTASAMVFYSDGKPVQKTSFSGNQASVTMTIPTGAKVFSWDYLDGSGNVLTSGSQAVLVN